MTYHYVDGARRWKRFTGPGDVRLYRSNRGWIAQAWVLGTHPITGKSFKQDQWWIFEIFSEYEYAQG